MAHGHCYMMPFKENDVMSHFYATNEDQLGMLAQYYEAPWLSARDVLWHKTLRCAARRGAERSGALAGCTACAWH